MLFTGYNCAREIIKKSKSFGSIWNSMFESFCKITPFEDGIVEFENMKSVKYRIAVPVCFR
jgi:hypothetical protein